MTCEEAVFASLHDWLEDDRDRRLVKIRADDYEIWHVSLFIDQHCVAAERGNFLWEVVAEAMKGMVIADIGGAPAREES